MATLAAAAAVVSGASQAIAAVKAGAMSAVAPLLELVVQIMQYSRHRVPVDVHKELYSPHRACTWLSLETLANGAGHYIKGKF